MSFKDRLISFFVGRVLSRFPYDISFCVREGIVFLEGKVNSYDDYLNIGLEVGAIRGVEGVVNNIVWRQQEDNSLPDDVDKIESNRVLGKFDVVIIGAGITGAMIARELSKYKLKIALVEKNPDVAMGVTKANNGLIHSGIEEKLGKLKTKLCVEGNRLYDELTRELGVKFKRIGGLWLISERSMPSLRKTLPRFLYLFVLRYILPSIIVLKAAYLGVKGVRIIRNVKEILGLEPYLHGDIVAAVYVPIIGIVDPYELAIALVENAVDNGVKTFFDCEVVGFVKTDSTIRGVITSRGIIYCSFVINAAGLYADKVSELAGAREYTIHPRKGVLIVFDKSLSEYVGHELAEIEIPRPERTKGGGINPTVCGNVIWGPTAVEVPRRDDVSVSLEELRIIVERFHKLLPDFPLKIIRYFAGVRPATFTEDFIIRPAKWVKGFIHVAGIQSPGLAASPAIARMVVQILRREGLVLSLKDDFKPHRDPPIHFSELNYEERQRLIEKDSRWGNIICQCEMVSEAEIVSAIERMKKIGVETITLEGIKFRTRAMMGRCQGSFCLIKVASIVSRYLGIDIWNVCFRGRDDKLGIGDINILLT